MRIRTVIAGGLLAVSALVVTAPAAVAATTAEPAAAPAGTVLVARAGAPCLVSGYSIHAAEEMAKDRISAEQVEDIVFTTCRRAVKQKNGNWKYTKGKIVVICNNNGYVVTAWRRR